MKKKFLHDEWIIFVFQTSLKKILYKRQNQFGSKFKYCIEYFFFAHE